MTTVPDPIRDPPARVGVEAAEPPTPTTPPNPHTGAKTMSNERDELAAQA